MYDDNGSSELVMSSHLSTELSSLYTMLLFALFSHGDIGDEDSRKIEKLIEKSMK